MDRDKIEQIIEKIAIESAELLEQVQWASIEPKNDVICKHLDTLENQIRDLRKQIG